jgi:transcriptional regulator with XRE-family HTH domain
MADLPEDDSDASKFGRVVRDARNARGWTLEALAEDALLNSMRKGYVSQVERGQIPNITRETVKKFARSLDIDPAFIPTSLRWPDAGAATGGPRIPTVDYSRLPETFYRRLVGRDAKLRRLDATWADSKVTIACLVAEGGAGKTALVCEWLKRFQAINYRDASAVLGWSFYNQGTKERTTSAEEFLNWAIDKLDITVSTSSASAKAELLADAIIRDRLLLVLDGIEPLQYGPGPQVGQFKDFSLRTLLRRLAATGSGNAHGLIILTSRLPLTDIARWQDSSAPVIDVEQLSEQDGADLLRDNGVSGTHSDLKAAAREFGGHPLALDLLASFLQETQSGDVRRRDRIRGFFSDRDNPRHDHAERVMESYEKEWLANAPALLAIMYLVGLFDRPASGDCLRALRKGPAINRLTGLVVRLNDSDWHRAVSRLREARLLAPLDSNAPEALDAHPLIREWFGERLRQRSARAWKRAHGRLYDHLRNTTEEGKQPKLEDLVPLYQAIGHGCCAGRYQKALEEIYERRISRFDSEGEYEFYALYQLGAVGTELSALSWFFEQRAYDVPIKKLREKKRSWLLGIVAYCLFSEGRLAEAREAQRNAMRMEVKARRWRNAAVNASNLSETELLLGHITHSIKSAEDAVRHADRSNFPFLAVAFRTTNAEALLSAGDLTNAKVLFRAAEALQGSLRPNHPTLDGSRGYRFCDLLLDEGEWVSVLRRVTQTIEKAEEGKRLVHIALDDLMLARAQLSLALADPTVHANNQYSILPLLDSSVRGLGSAGQMQLMPRALLARAAYYRGIGYWTSAERDYDEAEEISGTRPASMLLYLCDASLERARLALARMEAFAPLRALTINGSPDSVQLNTSEHGGLRVEAAKQLATAAEYIKRCGYHRRDTELCELQAVLRGERSYASLRPRA